MKCIKRFLAENVQEPNCMQCRAIYTKEFLDTNFSVHYRKSVLKSVREVILVERERQHLPDLMHRVSAYKTFSNIQAVITENHKKQNKLRTEKMTLERQMLDMAKENKDIKELVERQTVILEQIKVIDKEMETLYNEKHKHYKIYQQGGTTKVEKVFPCINLNCKGFLDNDFKCGLCTIQVCKECHEECKEHHKCDPNNVETVKAIQSETKPCPNCNTNIYKIIGCSQMFCTMCHTAFDWETGAIVRGRMHNPHYFEWLRGKNVIMPREIGDIPCGGLPQYYEIERKLMELDVPIGNLIYVQVVLKLLRIIQDKEIPKCPIVQGRHDDLDLCSVNYLCDLITERQWKNKLFQVERTKEMNTEKRLLYDTLMAVMVDMFNNIRNLQSANDVEDMLNNVELFRRYYNECVENLKLRFECVNFKYISRTWDKLI
jgi:hypothetical protein